MRRGLVITALTAVAVIVALGAFAEPSPRVRQGNDRKVVGR